MNRRKFVHGLMAASAASQLAPGLLFAQSSGQLIKRVKATSVAVPCRLDLGPIQRDIRMGGVAVEIETADGITGHGWTSITNNQIVEAAVNDVMAPALIDMDAFARAAIKEKLYWLTTPRGQTGHAVHAMSAIDLALWDILGKSLKQPVWRLLGGARKSVPTYTTFGMGYLNREQLAEAARHLLSIGQHRLKMVVAFRAYQRLQDGESLEAMLREDAERIRAVREAVGDKAELYIDANQALDPYHAGWLIDRIKDYGVSFFEEPLRGNDIPQMADLRRRSPIPIAAGQNEGHLNRWRDMLRANAVDVLQFNTCIGGGYTTCVKIAALAKAFNVAIDNGGAWPRFNMHLHAGVANGGLAEWHMGAVALERAFYKETIEPDGDLLHLPERPGVGFEIDQDVLKDSAI